MLFHNHQKQLTGDEVHEYDHRRHAEPEEVRRRQGAKPHAGFHGDEGNKAEEYNVWSERSKVDNLSNRFKTCRMKRPEIGVRVGAGVRVGILVGGNVGPPW